MNLPSSWFFFSWGRLALGICCTLAIHLLIVCSWHSLGPQVVLISQRRIWCFCDRSQGPLLCYWNPSFRWCSHLKFLFMYCILYISVEAISVVHIYTLTYDHPGIETMSSDFKSRANVPVGIIFISWSINKRMDTWSIWYPVTAAAVQEMSMTFEGTNFGGVLMEVSQDDLEDHQM